MSKEKKIKYETDTPVQGEYRDATLSALGKYQKFHEERRAKMSEVEKIIDERMFEYYFGEGSIVELDERVLPASAPFPFIPNVRQHIGKRGIVKKYYSDLHAFGRGYSYQMDVSFDGELCKGLPAYYFVDKTEEVVNEYIEWFDDKYGVKPFDTVNGIRYIDEYVTLRKEYTGELGDTELVLMLKEEGRYEESKKRVLEEYSVLTIDEYIEYQKG
jgi:hypothetical protein